MPLFWKKVDSSNFEIKRDEQQVWKPAAEIDLNDAKKFVVERNNELLAKLEKIREQIKPIEVDSRKFIMDRNSIKKWSPETIHGYLVDVLDAKAKAFKEKWNNPMDFKNLYTRYKDEYPDLDYLVELGLQKIINRKRKIRITIIFVVVSIIIIFIILFFVFALPKIVGTKNK